MASDFSTFTHNGLARKQVGLHADQLHQQNRHLENQTEWEMKYEFKITRTIVFILLGFTKLNDAEGALSQIHQSSGRESSLSTSFQHFSIKKDSSKRTKKFYKSQ